MTREAKTKLRYVVAMLCALGVGGYFIFAALPKIWEPRQFAVDIKNYQMLPQAYLNLVALYLPWLEVFAAIAIIVPKTRRPGSVIIAGLLLFFIGAVSYAAFYKGLDITCGCTGKNSAKAGWPTILRNTFLLILTFLSVWLPRKASQVAADVEVVRVPEAATDRPIRKRERETCVVSSSAGSSDR